MLISDIIQQLEILAPPSYQESYDNAGLITGKRNWNVSGVLCSLDCTEDVIQEAIKKNCNLIIAHHPIVFGGLKKINGNNYVEKAVITAIKNDIAIYAIHTNLDNVIHGVNNKIADQLGLTERKILAPKYGILHKLFTYVPETHSQKVTDALFTGGAGKIGLYEECSFSTSGTGTFKPIGGANPYSGKVGSRESVKEIKIEIIFPQHLQAQILKSLFEAHPYETVAYEIIKLENKHQEIGSGMIGQLPQAMGEASFLEMVKSVFKLSMIRHTRFLHKPVKTVAICGGAGSFLIKTAIAAKADIFITSDIKYHEFFDADNHLVVADIGHWESEQFTTDLLAAFLQDKFPNFAIFKTETDTNPIKYF